jgi:hypothetical protein
MSGLWSLPGPARFARTARARLDRGDSVLVGLPAVRDEDDAFHDELRGAVDVHFDLVKAVPAEERPVWAVVAEQLRVELPPSREAVVALAGDPMLEGACIAVRVTGKPDDIKPWTDFLRAFLAALRPIPPAGRPRLLITGGHGCATALSGAGQLAEQWWWGVLDRLDTACHVQDRLLTRDRDDLLRDAITEVAGFDLELASYLADEWGGDEADLPAALDGYMGPEWPQLTAPSPLPHSSTPLCAPPNPIVPLWNAGLADAWDVYGVYLHPCGGSAQELRQRLWRAQLRCLMPVIDTERARLETWVRGEVRGIPADQVLEPSHLFDLVLGSQRLKTWRGGHRKRLVYWLRDARNTLAHMGTLSPDDIARGKRLIWEDRKHG